MDATIIISAVIPNLDPGDVIELQSGKFSPADLAEILLTKGTSIRAAVKSSPKKE